LYVEGKYDEALAWLKDNKSDLSSELFHFNFGTILFKKNELAGARFHFEKAKKLGLHNSELKHNLSATKNLVQAQTKEQTSFIEQLGYSSTDIPGDYYFTAIFGCLLAGILMFKALKSKLAFILMALLSLSIFTFKLSYVDNKLQAVTLKETAVHEGPSEVFSSANMAPGGIKIIYSKKYQDWLFVVYPEYLTGWVKSHDVGIL
jgi:hypothetical protein